MSMASILDQHGYFIGGMLIASIFGFSDLRFSSTWLASGDITPKMGSDVLPLVNLVVGSSP